MAKQGGGERKTGQFLIMGGFRWGVGDTLAEAKKNFTRFGGRLSGGYAVVAFDEHTRFDGVDEMGRFFYEGNVPKQTVVKPRKRATR